MACVLHIFATGHRLVLSKATRMCGLDCNVLLCKLPVKSIGFLRPAFPVIQFLFFLPVEGSWNFKFLPALRQAEQIFAFFSMSVCIFGHQNMAASPHILSIPGCPKCKAFRAAYRSVLGMMIRSSTMTMPHLWVSFLATVLEVVWDLVAVVFFEAVVYFYQFWVGSRFFNQCFQIQHEIQFGCSYIVLLLFVSCSFLFYYPVYPSGQLCLQWGCHGFPERVLRDRLRVRVLSRLLRCLMMWLILCLCSRCCYFLVPCFLVFAVFHRQSL